jgi:hypothetical protein
MEMLFKVMRKGSLYYLLELGSRLRSLMNKKKANIVAICFPTTKNPYSEKALREVAKKRDLSGQARKLLEELLKVEAGEPLCIFKEEVEKEYLDLAWNIIKLENDALNLSYLDNLPYLRVIGPLRLFFFRDILKFGREKSLITENDEKR